jgi:hypothetical protein
VARIASEKIGGGILRDAYGRREIVLVDRDAALAGTDVPAAGTVVDADGREQIVVASTSTATAFRSAQIVIDVTQSPYNAKFDNATDDTAAIQAALNAAVVAVPNLATSGNDAAARIVQLPPGFGRVLGTLSVPPNVVLRGHGKYATTLYRPGATGVTDPILKVTLGSVMQRFVDFGVVCNDNAVTCIDLTGVDGPSILGDASLLLHNILCVGGNKAIFAPDGTELRFDHVLCYRQQTYGIEIGATDCYLTNCTVAACGQANSGGGSTSAFGISIAGANSRIVQCKVFGLLGSTSVAYSIAGSGRHEVAASEAQDCQNNAFVVNSGSVLSACLADSCGGAGFSMTSGAIVDGCAAVNRGGAYNMQWAATFPSGGTGTNNNHVKGLLVSGSPAMKIAPNDTVQARVGDFDAANRRGSQSVVYAATVTPDPWNGQDLYVGTLTANVTVANPSSGPDGTSAFFHLGQRLTVWLTQDGTGGRTVSFGTAYKTTGAVDTTASKTSAITFVYDGTNWRESGRAVT